MYPTLFSPLRLGHLDLRNRIVVPPMYQVRPITAPEGIAWYRRMAAGGPALVIVEVTSILRFGTELTLQSLRPLVEAIHKEGAAAGIQLFPIHFGQQVDPGSLSIHQIEGILEGYAAAAATCRDAGFDLVEPHGAHGYLLNQFFMPGRNQRHDEYGGSLAGRCRLGVRIVESIRHSVGPDYLIAYRHTPVGDDYGLEESLTFAQSLVQAGVNLLDISPARQSVEADLAAPFRGRFGVPIIAVNGMEDPAAAECALVEGRCDLVAVGRQMIADARWPQKVRQGRLDEIVKCQKCEIGCLGHLRQGRPVYCATWTRDEVPC